MTSPDPADVVFATEANDYFYFVGSTLFMGLLKMLIVPLIISSVIVGVASVGDFRQLGRIGLKTFAYYFATMLIAVTVGLMLVNTIRPGDTIGQERIMQAEQEFAANRDVQGKIETGPAGFGPAMLSILEQMIPTNPLAAAADPKIAALPIIFFSIFFAIVLTTIGAKGTVVVNFFDAVFEVMTKMVHVIILLAPIGVFCLLAWTVARIGLGVFAGAMATYMGTVLLGLAIHGLIILPLILWLFGRTNPYRFLHQMRAALMTAFGTDSSSATLPVTIESAVEEGGCSRKAAGFVLPLGATINMDGTALFEAVAVVFIAQSYGVTLGIEQSIIIALTATLTAIGAAGIPSASLVLMPVVISAVNQSMGGGEGVVLIPIAGIGLILGVDRLLDMSRTVVNVWGDAVGAKIISRSEPDVVPDV
jgi:Na+/H+-dicarboxylate symporter